MSSAESTSTTRYRTTLHVRSADTHTHTHAHTDRQTDRNTRTITTVVRAMERMKRWDGERAWRARQGRDYRDAVS
jgi:hypothetical protein